MNSKSACFADYCRTIHSINALVYRQPMPYFVDFTPSLDSSRCRLYFTSLPSSYSSLNIYYADVNLDDTGPIQTNLRLTTLQEANAFDSIVQKSKPSLAESLLRERMRSGYFSTADIRIDRRSGTFTMSYSGLLLQFSDHPQADKHIRVMPAKASSLQPAACPDSPNLVAFVDGSDVAVVLASSLPPSYLSVTHVTAPGVSAGTPSFVIEEEFDRYVGFWWRPAGQDPRGRRCLLYEETDESEVGVVALPHFSSWHQVVEQHAYPKPGKKNATSNLKMVTFEVNAAGTEIVNWQTHAWPRGLLEMLPEYEYLVRAGWTPNGDFFWVVLANRLQSKMSLFLVSPRSFVSHDAVPFTRLHDEVDEEFWVESHDCLQFFTAVDHGVVSYIWRSRQSGYAHLYLHRRRLPQDVATCCYCCCVDADVLDTRQLTHGDWEVLSDHVFVDETHHLVMFEGLAEHPLFANIYAVSYEAAETPPRMHRLSLESDWLRCQPDLPLIGPDARLSFSLLSFDVASGLCVIEASAPTLMPGQALFRLSVQHQVAPRLQPLVLIKPLVPVASVLATTPSVPLPLGPRLLSYSFTDPEHPESPLTFHGVLFTPALETRPPRGFPTIHMVYGGPGVQLVRGACMRNLIQRAQVYCHYGYALLVCDCRGSTNRGRAFAGHIKNRLGTVELADHTMFLARAVAETGLIDADRVAITGGSYGGYLTLMAAACYRDVYRAAVAVCPVVSWAHYDTAYTERYLGLPDDNETAYKNGDILTYAPRFPDQSPYLLIAHGGQDENVHFAHTAALLRSLDELGKPYQLAFYPDSRHRIRDDEHLMATTLEFLSRAL